MLENDILRYWKFSLYIKHTISSALTISKKHYVTICRSNFLLSVKLSLRGVDNGDWLRPTPADHEVRLGPFKHWLEMRIEDGPDKPRSYGTLLSAGVLQDGESQGQAIDVILYRMLCSGPPTDQPWPSRLTWEQETPVVTIKLTNQHTVVGEEGPVL